jgi:hypothetical protein
MWWLILGELYEELTLQSTVRVIIAEVDVAKSEVLIGSEDTHEQG